MNGNETEERFRDVERSLARGNVYSLLSLCFSYPDDEVYTCIVQGERLREARKSLRLLADDHFEECLSVFADVSCGGQKAGQEEMAWEYTRLFSNSLSPIVSPSGPACLENEALVSGEKTSAVLSFFREAGFATSRGDIPGHLAQQMEFMDVLAVRESQSSCGERIHLEEIQLDFLSRFLIAEVSAFCEKVKKEGRVPFYIILGDLTQEFIGFETNYLGISEAV